MLVGVFVALRSTGRKGTVDGPGVFLLLLLAACYSAVHLLTWTLVRYRLPVDAITMPFAAAGAVFVWRRIGIATIALTRARADGALAQGCGDSTSETRM